VTHLGRLVYRVPDFPLDSLLAVLQGPGEPVALAGMDWAKHYELVRISRRNACVRIAQKPPSVE
jgi:hypothetical protein